MPIYRVDKFISDFDETISKEDTIQALVLAAMRNRAADASPTMEEWEQTVEWYRSRYSHKCNKWLDGSREHCQGNILDFLSEIEALEMDSIRKVMKEKFLAGLRREQLRKAGSQVLKQQDAKACLSEMRSAGVTVEILSANWSQTLVKESVKGLCDSVVTNRLLFDERGYSTGDIELRVASARDKWIHFKSRQSKTGLTGYVGDSISDLRAILEADVGILIGENQTCLRAIERFQIPIRRVTLASHQAAYGSETCAPNKQIFHADSWKAVNRLLKHA